DASHGDEADQLQPATAPGVVQPASADSEQRENGGDTKNRAPGVGDRGCRRSSESEEEDEPPVFGSRRRAIEVCVLHKADSNGLLECHALPPAVVAHQVQSTSEWTAGFRLRMATRKERRRSIREGMKQTRRGACE